jgi:hypothetical protein
VEQKYGRLTVIGDPVKKGKHIYLPCRCDCGTERLVRRSNLVSHNTQSCGCLHKEKCKKEFRWKYPRNNNRKVAT